MTLDQLTEKLLSEGGALVRSDMASELEISDAQCTGRMAVLEDGIGIIWRYPEWVKGAQVALRKQTNATDTLRERSLWLQREIDAGGNHEHLSARKQECDYIASNILR